MDKSTAEVLLRRLELTEGLIEAYKDEYWRVASLLAKAKEGASLEEYRQQTAQDPALPHAVELPRLSARECSGPADTLAFGTDIVRAEQSSMAYLSREMKQRGALAVLLGVTNSYYVRSHTVTVGRRDADVDLTAEVRECDRSVSRLQARIFLDDIGWRLLNIGKRPMSVDGVTVMEGEHAPLRPLTLVSVATASVLFLPL